MISTTSSGVVGNLRRYKKRPFLVKESLTLKIIDIMNKTFVLVVLIVLSVLATSYVKDARMIQNKQTQNNVDRFAEMKVEYIASVACYFNDENECVNHNLVGCDFKCQIDQYLPNHLWVGENIAYGPQNTSCKGTDMSCVNWCDSADVYEQWKQNSRDNEILNHPKLTGFWNWITNKKDFESFKVKKTTVDGKTYCYSVLERYQ